MAMWPFSENMLRDGYVETVPNNVIRSTMDKGPQKVRRRTTANVRKIEFQLKFTRPELQTFDDFYLANDSVAFDFTHPRTNQQVRARFTDVPSYSLNETVWQVAVKLEILP